MTYYLVEPEVGGWPVGDDTSDWTTYPPKTTKLYWEMECWLGDALLCNMGLWIATVATMDAIKAAGLTGVTFDDVEVIMVEQFQELHPDLILPKFVWLKIDGKAGEDDFGIDRDFILVVSTRALKLLQGLGISHAKVEPYNG
jgi:hypothetical protein